MFATAKGWSVQEEHISIDDGISGSSRSTRLKDKAQMLDAILGSKTPPFHVLICQAPDRFSRRDGDESTTFAWPRLSHESSSKRLPRIDERRR